MTVSVQLLSLLECSVLTWHPAGDIHVTCMREVEGGGGYSPSQGVGQITPGHWHCLRVNCGHVFFSHTICTIQ